MEAEMIAAESSRWKPAARLRMLPLEVGVSTRTIYAWVSKYGGMAVSEGQEAKRLRDENARRHKRIFPNVVRLEFFNLLEANQ